MKVTGFINIRWNQYKGFFYNYFFPFCQFYVCWDKLSTLNWTKNNHAIHVENISKVAKALWSTSEITKLYECPQCTHALVRQSEDTYKSISPGRGKWSICGIFLGGSSTETKRFDLFDFFYPSEEIFPVGF